MQRKCAWMQARRISLALLIASVAGSAAPMAFAQQGLAGSGGDPAPGRPELAPPEPNKQAQSEQTTKPSKPKSYNDKQVEPDTEHPSYLVATFIIEFASEHPQNPPVEDLLATEVVLGRTDEGYVAPSEGVEKVVVRIGDVPLEPARKWTSRALFAVAKALRDEMNSYGIVGVWVSPSPEEFAPAADPQDAEWGKDLRREGQTSLKLTVGVGIVTELRTLSFGERVPEAQRINSPLHARILENSPVKVYTQDDAVRRDVLRKDLLDQYVFRLNRFPGRRVDLAVSAATERGGVALDYLINEAKPWTVYAQISNTGTEETNEWRERFGYVNNQLTNNDDILTIDYITAGFDANALIVSYDFPVVWDWLRFKPFANINDYTASDVGQAGEDFTGNGWAAGGDFTANVFQLDDLFVDLYGGGRWQHVEVNNEAVEVRGEDDFFIIDGGARLERSTDIASTTAALGFEANLAGVAQTDSSQDLAKLGRQDPDRSWVVGIFEASHAFYLEPFFMGDSWQLGKPGADTTLAHEIVLSARGQFTDSRLVPNFEQVVGGLYTVRGYPESIVAGDTVIIGSAEYRFHLPQALGLEPNPGQLYGETFRWKPQTPYGRADWDLILKGFVDVARALNSDRLSYEHDETLIGAGVGLELLVKRNFSLRAEFGVTLDAIEDEVDVGDSEFHFSATILY